MSNYFYIIAFSCYSKQEAVIIHFKIGGKDFQKKNN